MWYALVGVTGLIVCLIVGFWIGHRAGYDLCKDDVKADFAANGLISSGLAQDIRWAYRELLFREPTPKEVAGWTSPARSIAEICRLFTKSTEYKRLPNSMKNKARRNASSRGIVLPS